MTRFPREVRDMVYSAMLDRGHAFRNLIQLSRAAHERHLGCLSTSSSAFPPLVCKLGMGGEKHEHCWDIKFCGEPFLKELVERCYREKTFEFRQQDLYLPPIFLGQSPRPLRITNQNTVVPVQHVGRIRLCIRPTGNGWRFTLETLKILLKLQRKATIEAILDMNLVIENSECDIERVIVTYRSLFPLFASIRDRGHKVSFLFGAMSARSPALAMRSTREWVEIAQEKLDAASSAS